MTDLDLTLFNDGERVHCNCGCFKILHCNKCGSEGIKKGGKIVCSKGCMDTEHFS